MRARAAPEIEALVQVVMVTKDRPQALADLSNDLQGVSPDVLDQTPFVLVGTIEEMAAQFMRQAERLGITR